MEIDKDMENFAKDASLNNLSNHGLGAMNLGDEDADYYAAGANEFDANNFPDDLFGTLFDDIKTEPSMYSSEPVFIPSRKRSSNNKSHFALDNNIVETLDLFGWRKKRKEEWGKIDTINWILSNGEKFGQSFGSMSPDLALPGKELLNLSKREFIKYNGDFGERLFNLLHKGRKSKKYPNPLDDYATTDSEDEVPSDETPAPDPNIKRSPGRPRILDKKTKQPRKKLWEFVRDALLNPQLCPRVICWENYEEGIFRIVNTVRISEIWGERNNKENSTMNYEKFSRAMRYYYKKDILVSVPCRLYYKFGSMATGWKTDCPNFDPNYFSNRVKSEP